MKKIFSEEKWRSSSADIFWGEIAPCDHVLQIYENDAVFIDTLAEFVRSGLTSKDGVIIIATREHRAALHHKLEGMAIKVNEHLNRSYFPIDASEMLSRFMVNGWPDEKLFMTEVTTLLQKVRVNNKKVRAFGEMVAILWAGGFNGATVHLEYLWNKFCQTEAFCLFCAYPRSGFTDDIHESLQHICSAHSKMISLSLRSSTNVQYTRNEAKKAV